MATATRQRRRWLERREEHFYATRDVLGLTAQEQHARVEKRRAAMIEAANERRPRFTGKTLRKRQARLERARREAGR